MIGREGEKTIPASNQEQKQIPYHEVRSGNRRLLYRSWQRSLHAFSRTLGSQCNPNFSFVNIYIFFSFHINLFLSFFKNRKTREGI